MNKSKKKIFSIIIKSTILILAAYFIHKKLTDNQNLITFFELINKVSIVRIWVIGGIIFLLMLLNWVLESLKWHYLIKKVEKISHFKAIESVFCGLTWAVFTPNRIGEYGGRIFFLSPRKRIYGMVAMSVGNIGQLLITNVFGSIAFLWFIYNFKSIDLLLFFALAVMVFFFCCFFILFFFNINLLQRLLKKISFLKKFNKYISVLNRYEFKDLAKVILYSVSRYVVFTTQYLLIFHLLIPEIYFYQAALMIFILFFIQSALPSLDLLDIGVRSLTASYFFGYITNQEVAVMASTALIWFVNLIIPAILGSAFVFKQNFFDSHNN